jgi:hypothetical protein
LASLFVEDLIKYNVWSKDLEFMKQILFIKKNFLKQKNLNWCDVS